MDFSKALGIIKGIPGKIKGFFSALFLAIRQFKLPKLQFQKPDFSELFGKIREKVNSLIDWARDLIDSLLDRIPEEKKRPFLIGLGSLGGLILLLLVLVIVKPGRGANSTSAMARGLVIPQEELFLPSEPDFVPEFLLEREPRRAWLLEDIRPYWKSPEISGFWREEIKTTIDNLLEGIP